MKMFDVVHTKNAYHAVLVDTAQRQRSKQVLEYYGSSKTFDEALAFNVGSFPTRNWVNCRVLGERK